MTVFCHTCRKSFSVDGTGTGVFKCSTCGTQYFAVDDGSTVLPRLFKLTRTKSYVVERIKSKIVKLTQQRLVVTPAEAMAETRGRR